MPRQYTDLAAPAGATGPGAAVALDPALANGASYNVHFVIPGTATAQMQISHDDVTWTNLGSAQSSSAVVALNLGGVRFIRLNNTAWTSGANTARVHGRSPAKVYT